MVQKNKPFVFLIQKFTEQP